MGQFVFFANLYTTLIAPIMAQMQALIGNVCGAMEPIAHKLLLLALIIEAILMLFGIKTASSAARELFIGAMVVTTLQTGQYIQYFSDLFLQAIPNAVGAALGGVNFSPVAGLDQAVGATMRAAATNYEALPSMSLKIVPLGLMIMACAALSVAALAYSFYIFMRAAIWNVVLIVVGPIFVAAAAIPAGRQFFNGWLRTVVGGCVTQLIVTAILVVLLPAENNLINQVIVTAAGTGSNTWVMIWGLFQSTLLMFLCAGVVAQSPAAASHIAGGIYHGSSAASAWTFGLASGAASSVMSAPAAMGRAAATARYRAAVSLGRPPPTSPPGRSLSGGSP